MSECRNISECNENVFIFNALVRKMEKRLCQEPPVKDWWHENATLRVVLEHTQNSTSDSNHSSKTSGILMFKIFLFSLIGLFMISNASAIYIGITDGYVKDNLGNLVSGASVTVSVTGCSGDGCSGTGTSEANGYYVVANLNLPKLGGVSVTATKSGGSGSATGNADNYQVAHVNISVCYPPTSASLTPVADSENPSVIFTWTSGTDPNSLPQHDDFRLDGTVTSPATSPQSRTVSFTTHTWDARTCNNYCCSGWASDSFTISCTPPSVPVQIAVPDSHSTSANFVWTSGTDPLLRPIYDEFQFDSEAVISPASSPISRAGLSYATHTWKTRTCNDYCCSGWASDSFTVGNQPPSVPTGTNATPHNATTDLIWVSGIDPELDPTYDEFQLSGSSVVSPATSPQTVVSQILIKWQVRTCDNLGACSAWVSVESVTCSEISQFCPAAQELERIVMYGGGGGGGCPAEYKRKAEIYCNGIAYENITMFRLDMITGKTIAQISIQGKNISLKNLEYCPWCYDGKKNFDETGVDCGGSCRDCAQIEIPARISVWLAVAAGILIAGAIGYWIYRAMKKKSLLKTKKPISR